MGTSRKDIRSEPRQSRLRICQMDSPDLGSQLVIMFDISPHGMACRAVKPPQIGDIVRFRLGGVQEVQAEVTWVRDGRFGIRFHEEVDSILISLSRTGFRSMDYDLPRDEGFERLMLIELFRAGELH